MALYDTYIPLLTYRHAAGKAGSKVIPGLPGVCRGSATTARPTRCICAAGSGTRTVDGLRPPTSKPRLNVYSSLGREVRPFTLKSLGLNDSGAGIVAASRGLRPTTGAEKS